MKKVFNKVKVIIDKVKEKNVGEYTASCAYYTLLAFIPLIMLILTLTKYIGIEQETLFIVIDKVAPSNILNDAILGVIKEVYSKSVSTVTISFLFVLWSAGKGFFALCKGLNAIYDVSEDKRYVYFRIKAIICTIIFIILIVSMLLVLVFGNTINFVLQQKLNIFNKIVNFILNEKIFISIILLLIVFVIMYKFIPKHKCKIKYQVLGALFAAIACTAISIFYSVYVDLYKGFSIMYGSLTTIVLAMMWIYGCMYSILLGAVINKLIGEKYKIDI